MWFFVFKLVCPCPIPAQINTWLSTIGSPPSQRSTTTKMSMLPSHMVSKWDDAAASEPVDAAMDAIWENFMEKYTAL